MNQDGVSGNEDQVAGFRRRLRGAAAELRQVLDSVPPTGDVAETEDPVAARARNAGLSALFKTGANLAGHVERVASALPTIPDDTATVRE